MLDVIVEDGGDLTINQVSALAATYEEVVNQFYALAVPSSLLDVHLKEIELLGTKKNIFEKMNGYEADPMAAVLAAQELEKLDLEFTQLENKLNTFILDRRLNA